MFFIALAVLCSAEINRYLSDDNVLPRPGSISARQAAPLDRNHLMTRATFIATDQPLPTRAESKPMNTIIYIGGLVVIVGVILFYFGLR
jgi:hypothetical protein